LTALAVTLASGEGNFAVVRFSLMHHLVDRSTLSSSTAYWVVTGVSCEN
jgi:hypothetical protein